MQAYLDDPAGNHKAKEGKEDGEPQDSKVERRISIPRIAMENLVVAMGDDAPCKDFYCGEHVRRRSHR